MEATPLGKLILEKRLFEMNENWDAVESLQKKIVKYLNDIKVRNTKRDEERQYETPIPCM